MIRAQSFYCVLGIATDLALIDAGPGGYDRPVGAMLQALLEKFVSGDALQLYRNGIKGIDSFDWKAFPRALVVSDDRLYCETIEDRLTEVKGLLDFMVR